MNTIDLPASPIKSRGIVIRLYRRPIFLPETPDLTADFQYTIWGYFDWMKIEGEKRSLHDLFINHRSSSIKHEGYEEQILCVYPQEGESFILEKIENSQYPLVVLTELKLFEDSIKKYSIDTIKCEIEKKLKTINPNLSFQIVYSLGYSDLVIIFCHNSYEVIMDLLVKLKKEPVIKSLYSIHGMSPNNTDYWNYSETETASIFISTKPQADFSYIYNRVDTQLKKSGEIFDISLFPLMGKYDMEMRITPKEKRGIPYIAQLFSPNELVNDDRNILFSSNKFFIENINYTRTRWVSKHKELSEKSNKKNSISDFSFEKKFKDLWNKGQELIKLQSGKEKSYPESLLCALQDLLKYFWQIQSNDVASPLLQSELFKLLGILYKTLEHDIKNNSQDIDIDCLEYAVPLFSDLLQNWVQATRMVFEGPNYNLKFINSSTKVYISYFTIIELLEKQIEQLKNKSEIVSPKLEFFPTISFTELVKSHYMFPKSTYTKERIIPIRFDKISFFSPSKSIPWLLHEMGHYPQSSKIHERNVAFFETICMDIARRIFMFTVVGNENPYLLEIHKKKWEPIANVSISLIEDILYKEFLFFIEDEIDNPSFEDFTYKLSGVVDFVFGYIDNELQSSSERVKDLLKQKKENSKLSPESYLLHEHLVNWLFDAITNGQEIDQIITFWQESHDFSCIKEDIFPIILKIAQTYKNKKEHLQEICEQIGKAIFSGISSSNEEHFFDSELLNSQDSSIHILEYAGYFVGQGLIENTDKNKNKVKKNIQSILTTERLNLGIGVYKDMFQETAADLFMIKVLGLTSKEYIDIIKLAEKRISDFYPSDEADNQEILMQTREKILLEQYFEIEPTSNEHSSPWQKTLSTGFYDSKIGNYLKCLNLEFDQIIENDEIKFLHDSFKRIFHSTEDDLFYNETKFIEYYWKKGLEVLNGRERGK